MFCAISIIIKGSLSLTRHGMVHNKAPTAFLGRKRMTLLHITTEKGQQFRRPLKFDREISDVLESVLRKKKKEIQLSEFVRNGCPSSIEKGVRINRNKHVKKGTTVFTDESKAYNSLINKDFEHGTVNHSVKEYVKGMASTNGIESVWAMIKRGYNGVYHNWSKKHRVIVKSGVRRQDQAAN